MHADFIYILYEDKIPIGMYCIVILSDYVWYLSSFGIVESHRRKGYGKLLYEFISGGRSIDILFSSDPNNDDASKFYSNVGAKMLKKSDNSIIWAI